MIIFNLFNLINTTIENTNYQDINKRKKNCLEQYDLIKSLYTFLFINPYEILYKNDSNKTDEELYLETRFTNDDVDIIHKEIDLNYPKIFRLMNLRKIKSLQEFMIIFKNKDSETFKKYKDVCKDYEIFFKNYKSVFNILCSRLQTFTMKNCKELKSKNLFKKFKYQLMIIPMDEKFLYQILNIFIVNNIKDEFLVVKNFKSFLKTKEFEKGYEMEYKSKLLKPLYNFIAQNKNLEKKIFINEFLDVFQIFMKSIYDKQVNEVIKNYEKLIKVGGCLRLILENNNYLLIKSINEIIRFSYIILWIPNFSNDLVKNSN
ncbi:hypothetical protein A0H76_35 [Hepatospora eriocheir]|uniref:Uncharacterized protein n=1 Tax=Hepatospora eriocheir TaxID=1081669 RepID=A0A1X0QF13_9MICR|nr:hypothetical protein A0H76_35 [Hepatospora eriocheir]